MLDDIACFIIDSVRSGWTTICGLTRVYPIRKMQTRKRVSLHSRSGKDRRVHEVGEKTTNYELFLILSEDFCAELATKSTAPVFSRTKSIETK